MLEDFECDEKTREQLARGGLAEVTASLWAADCQTCGRSLGDRPPALCVDALSGFATAGLHHQHCRPAVWNDSSVVFASAGNHLTWTTVSFLLPGVTGRKADPRPVMMLNPGLEMIVLEQRRGGWRPGYDVQFTSLGLRPPGRKLRLDRPLGGASAWLADDLISVTVESTDKIYEANAPTEVVARARELRGVLLMVTHAVDPARLSRTGSNAWKDIIELLRSGRVICGWLAATPGR